MKHAAWHLQGRQFDGRRYDMIFTCAEPKRKKEGATVLYTMCLQDSSADAADGSPADAYERHVHLKDAWLRDAAKELIQGWGAAGRYCVDWSHTRFGAVQISRTLNARMPEWADGYHIDDLFWRPAISHAQADAIKSETRWRQAAMQMLKTLDPLAISGGRDYYEVPGTYAEGRIIKLEGFRFGTRFWSYRWGGPTYARLTLRDWIVGRDGWGPGIAGMQQQGCTVVLEAWRSPSWDAETEAAYAKLAAVTAALLDCHLMYHREGGDWWKKPEWRPVFDEIAALEEPTGPAQIGDQWIIREYERGTLRLDMATETATVEER